MTERHFPARTLRKLVAACASAFMLLKQDGAKLSEFFSPVGQEAQDCLAVVGFERDRGGFESPGVFEFVGDFEFVCVSEAAGELKHGPIGHLDACEEHTSSVDPLGAGA